MNINDKLENIWIFSKGISNNCKRFLNYLSQKGIITVNDLLKADPNIINKENAYYLKAIIRILKADYLNQTQELDKLLQAIYQVDDYERLAKDLRELGFDDALKRCQGYAQIIMKTYDIDYQQVSLKQILTDAIECPRLLPKALNGTDFKEIYLFYLKKYQKDNKKESSNIHKK